VFIGPKLPKTRYKLIVGATTVEKRGIMPTDAPIRAPVPIRLPLLHLHLLVEPTLFLLLPNRTMLMGESTILLWRKPRKLRTWSLVCFSSMTLLQFFINDTSVVVLFDSGASHSLISSTSIEKHNLPIALLKCQMILLREEICPHDNYARR
jgi:hypothetical protein